ncbi:probable methyltransferase-like protein 15 homolog [Neocloeon triangulifer]|uniref:probable methyltransferase-like protein 15 homolog n=1 Tax=Neocloeon triangulifer TaxID=2078957 RepID=UPI00286F70E7|nr:probable methyltransferase-like protein 15 homolog [Neocloeon triangulifer]
MLRTCSRRVISRLFSISQSAALAEETPPHVPVMVDLVAEHLQLSEGKTIVDMTFGAGGHTKKMFEVCPEVKVIALDRDPVAFEYAQNLAADHPLNLTPLLGKFSELPILLNGLDISPGSLDGMLLDLGCSSMQMNHGHRGFSISREGPLDMRMDSSPKNPDPTVAEVLAHIEEDELAKTLKIYGEERQAKKIARAVVEARYAGIYMRTTKELSELVAEVCGIDHRQDKLQRHAHSATKVFQALRILVNNELNEINYAMLLASRYLKKGGRLLVLTFHSLEDKIVKRHLFGHVSGFAANVEAPKYSLDMQEPNTCWHQLHKHVIIPSDDEVYENPRSRSAKLRVAEKVK